MTTEQREPIELETWVDLLDQLDLRRTDCAYDVRRVVDDIRLGEWETAKRRTDCLYQLAQVWKWERLSGISSLLLAVIAIHERDDRVAGYLLDSALYDHLRLFEGPDNINNGLIWFTWAAFGALRGFSQGFVYRHIGFAVECFVDARDQYALDGDEEGHQHALRLMDCIGRLMPDRWQFPLTVEQGGLDG